MGYGCILDLDLFFLTLLFKTRDDINDKHVDNQTVVLKKRSKNCLSLSEAIFFSHSEAISAVTILMKVPERTNISINSADLASSCNGKEVDVTVSANQ